MKNFTSILTLLFLTLVTSQGTSQCFSSITSNYAHVNAKKTDGTYWGWGANSLGMLGLPDLIDRHSPTLIPDSSDWNAVFSGRFNSFIIKNNGTLWGTGYNLYGILGVGTTQTVYGQYTQIGNTANWKQVESNFYSIGLKTDGTLWGWGQNNGNQMGDNTCCDNRLSPGQIGNDTDWKTIAISSVGAAFAIKNNGTLWGWGTNIAGLLGDNLLSGRPYPTQHNSDVDWGKISLGAAHILALKTNGTLWSWGAGGTGATGDGLPANYNRFEPIQVGIDNNWVVISAGQDFSMAIKSDGTLWGWGSNDVNQLGDGTNNNKPLPVQIGNATNWQSVAAAYQNTVALKTDGSLWSWGANDYGQLGNGSLATASSPTNITVTGCVLAAESFEANHDILVVSPNPSHNDLTIHYDGKQIVNTILIYDLSGREVYSNHPMASKSFMGTFSVAQLENGHYILVLKNDSKVVLTRKWIKK